MTFGKLALEYDGSNFFNINNSIPGDNTSSTFTVKNIGHKVINSYDIYFSKIMNTFTNGEMVFTISCLSSDLTTCNGKSETAVP